MIWNKKAFDAIKTIFARLSETQKTTIPFLLLSGPENIWKTSAVMQYMQDYLGEYYQQDSLLLFDCSRRLWKKHTLKISVPAKEQLIVSDDWVSYQNLWSREIIDWLSRSGMSWKKVLFLENIERMSIWAANALLKSLEELMLWKIIIATTRNSTFLLDTIISRAMIIRFHPVPYRDMLDRAVESRWWSYEHSFIRFAVASSAWSPWKVVRMLQGEYDHTALKTMSELYDQLVAFYTDGWSVSEQFQRFQKRTSEYWSVQSLIDALLYSIDPTVYSVASNQLLYWKKLAQTTVSNDTIMFYLSLNKVWAHDTIT